MKRFPLIVFAVALTACSGNGQTQQSSSAGKMTSVASYGESEIVAVQPQVPELIQRSMAEIVQPDGQVHVVHMSGKFSIRPLTRFCQFVPGFGVDDLRGMLRQIGQSDYIGGEIRTNGYVRSDAQNSSLECSVGNIAADTIFVQGTRQPNHDGKPYKLVLAVWQGNVADGGASWVGIVERVDGGPRPQIFNPYHTDPIPFEVGEDISSLSKAFSEFVLRGNVR